ncbi:MAG: thioredoxin family protein [Gemmatimonadota bacterium]
MRDRFILGATFEDFLEEVRSLHPWRGIYNRARVPDDLLRRAKEIDSTWHLLVLTEDWCGDGANSVPYLAKLAEATPSLELRLLSRDENPDLMDAHLTEGTRSIPVVMILDEGFREVAWWGPRPAPLQALFLREVKTLPKEERYPRLRAWYAQDRGRTTLEEVFSRIPVSV